MFNLALFKSELKVTRVEPAVALSP